MIALKIKALLDELAAIWNVLPQAVKVFCYIFISAVVAEVYNQLSSVKLDNMILAGLVNVLLVVIRETTKPKGENR